MLCRSGVRRCMRGQRGWATKGMAVAAKSRTKNGIPNQRCLIRHEFFSSYPMYHLENFPTQIFNLKTADTLHLNFDEIFCEKVISSLSKQAKGKK